MLSREFRLLSPILALESLAWKRREDTHTICVTLRSGIYIKRTNIRIPFFLHMQGDGRRARHYSWLLTLGVVTSTSQTAWLYSRVSHFLSFPLIFVRLGLDSQKLLSVKSVRTAASVHSWILVLQTIWPSQRTPQTLSHLLLPKTRICSNEPHSDLLL